ncbi:diketo-D-gluconic acid reductase [Seminavis robusta]|uniref:Diketo-D-gluconic acid reductase n=1 Tax=Seminavis robusta TaxID=568900 RepID=A0A9N8HIF7_9STRA|nr:diketo-D-gluconic acid reductase [Seminavis robusta]|eukprot:Sro621_g176770.1 diketo-D-gluconic acid reductase (578) ;mRNA; f:24765-26714
MSNDDNDKEQLSFSFRGQSVPVTWSAAVSLEQANMTLVSKPFRNWVQRIESSKSSPGQRQIQIESVELQSVDMFGARGVGFAKIKSHCKLQITSNSSQEAASEDVTTTNLPGICLLRGDAVAILVALFCTEDDTVHSLLVEQPRIPIAQVDCLELPAGMMDDDTQTIKGMAVKEMEEECGIVIEDPSELIDLSQLAFEGQKVGADGIPMSQGGCDERMRLLYLEKFVTKAELDQMRNRTTGLREEGEVITLRIVPYEDVWRVSADSKAIIARFLVEQLRKEGKVPDPGKLATPLLEPTLKLPHTAGNIRMPQLAFGCYKVPDSSQGEEILNNAIQAGYRHFDTASYYNNEATVGRVLKRSGIPRDKFFLASKVWNDAQKEGRVRESVLQSLEALDFGGYWDLFLVHWPVPNHFIETYRELELLQQQGKIKAIGLSNFSIDEYETLVQSGIRVPPVVNQFEVSPFLYRPEDVEYFQQKHNMIVSASKAMHRGGALNNDVVQAIAKAHNVTPAQVMIRWSLQKNLVVLTMSSSLEHQRQNRDVTGFALSDEEMSRLDSLTDEETIKARVALEEERKKSM